MTKVRAISPNVLNRKDSYWYDFPVIRTIHWYLIQLRRTIINLLRRHNVVCMHALRRGEWYDSDTRVFEACFQILVDYVEKELAWMQLLTEGHARWYHRWVPIKNGRELGLRYLAWEVQLGDDSPHQSQSSAIIKDLYLWYKDVRPARIDPWNALPDPIITIREGGSVEPDPEAAAAGTKAFNEEELFTTEDNEQLIRLIQVRGSMWT
jgi:hypothetical protein